MWSKMDTEKDQRQVFAISGDKDLAQHTQRERLPQELFFERMNK